MFLDLESLRALPTAARGWVPPLHERMHLWVGAPVRLLAVLDGVAIEYPYVRVTEIPCAGCYVGTFIDDYGPPGRRIPCGMEIAFTYDNVIEI